MPLFKRVMGDRVEIQVAEWVGDSGKDVLCIHGLSANCRCWDVIAEALVPDFRVLAIDLRGCGLSGKPRGGYSVEYHARDIKALIANLELDRPVIMGHSMGAVIALAVAAWYPQLTSGVILIDGAGVLSKKQMAAVMAGIKPSIDRLGRVYPFFGDFLDHMKKAPFLHPWVPALDTYFEYETEEVAGGVRSRVHPDHIAEEIRNLKKIDASDLYPRVRCPVLILNATDGLLAPDDILLPEEALQKMLNEIPDAKSVTLQGTNHFSIVFQSNQDRDRSIRDFIRLSLFGTTGTGRGETPLSAAVDA